MIGAASWRQVVSAVVCVRGGGGVGGAFVRRNLRLGCTAVSKPGGVSRGEQAELDRKMKAAKHHMRDEQLGKAHAQTVSEVRQVQLVEGVHNHEKAGGLTDDNVLMDRRLDAIEHQSVTLDAARKAAFKTARGSAPGADQVTRKDLLVQTDEEKVNWMTMTVNGVLPGRHGAILAGGAGNGAQ